MQFLQQFCATDLRGAIAPHAQLGVAPGWALMFAEIESRIWKDSFEIQVKNGLMLHRLDTHDLGPILLPVGHYNVSPTIPMTAAALRTGPNVTHGYHTLHLIPELPYAKQVTSQGRAKASSAAEFVARSATVFDYADFKNLYQKHVVQHNGGTFETLITGADWDQMLEDPHVKVLVFEDGLQRVQAIAVYAVYPGHPMSWIQTFWNRDSEFAVSKQVSKVVIEHLFHTAVGMGVALNLGKVLEYKTRHWVGVLTNCLSWHWSAS